jgi:hypothetical protein
LSLLSLTIDLGIPPLALLLLMVCVTGIASVLFYFATDAVTPLYLSMASLFLLGLSVVLSWARYARHMMTWQDLMYAPVYALRKIPLYQKYFVNRQVEWVRSRRDGE